jgi:hypothetical protein
MNSRIVHSAGIGSMCPNAVVRGVRVRLPQRRSISRPEDQGHRNGERQPLSRPRAQQFTIRQREHRVDEYAGPSCIDIGARSLSTCNNFILK